MKKNPYQVVEDIAREVQHKRTKEAAAKLVDRTLESLQGCCDLGGGTATLDEITNDLKLLVNRIQDLPL